MGMFDNIIDYKLACPRCGTNWMMNLEIQTKDFKNAMDELYIKDQHKDRIHELVGEKIKYAKNDKNKYINANFSCRSPSCDALARMYGYVNHGYASGFGLCWDVKYKTNDEGYVISGAEILKRFEMQRMDEGEVYVKFGMFIDDTISKYPEAKKKWDKAMEVAFGNIALAVLHFHWSKNLEGGSDESVV